MKYDSLFTEIDADIEKIPSDDFRIKENKYKKEGWLRIQNSNLVYEGIDIAFISATGRNKRSVATALIYRGNCFNQDILVNGMDFKEYFQNNPIIINEIQKLQNYFPATWIETNTQSANEIELTPLGQRKGFFTAHVSVKGGGLTSQAKAVRLAIARAASKMGVDEKTNLRAGNLLTTDARRKERKKYGLKKARKRPQFSKR
tara:strand:+ start:1442 stop:2047 length:606 start_codon:yes stop_codon:yes gene_type:complete